MPIYEYKCRTCGHPFEELVRLGETPNCPSCNGNDLERLRSPPPALSTDKTRKRTMGAARQKAGAVKREKDHADAEYIRRHHEEDHH